MAKELAWKASKVLKPRGFESHALRQKIKDEVTCLIFYFFCLRHGARSRKGVNVAGKSGELSGSERSEPPE